MTQIVPLQMPLFYFNVELGDSMQSFVSMSMIYFVLLTALLHRADSEARDTKMMTDYFFSRVTLTYQNFCEPLK